MAETISINTTLLPPREIMDIAIKANQELTGGRGEIKLGPEESIPHITVVMGCVLFADLPKVEKALREIAKRTPPLALAISSVETERAFGKIGNEVSSLNIDRTPALEALFQNLRNVFDKFLISEAPRESVAPSLDFDPGTLLWINNYQPKSKPGDYRPHITLGFGRPVKPFELPIEFTANRLALCHVGNRCTCAKIISEYTLL